MKGDGALRMGSRAAGAARAAVNSAEPTCSTATADCAGVRHASPSLHAMLVLTSVAGMQDGTQQQHTRVQGVLTAGCCPHAAAAGWAGRRAGPTPVWIGRPGGGGEAVVSMLRRQLLLDLLLRCCMYHHVPRAVQQAQAQHRRCRKSDGGHARLRPCWASPHLWQRAGQVVVVEAAGEDGNAMMRAVDQLGGSLASHCGCIQSLHYVRIKPGAMHLAAASFKLLDAIRLPP